MDSQTVNYMLGHVLLNSSIPPREWSEEELAIAFAMLPSPKKSLVEFKEFFKDDKPKELTEEEKINLNTIQLEKVTNG